MMPRKTHNGSPFKVIIPSGWWYKARLGYGVNEFTNVQRIACSGHTGAMFSMPAIGHHGHHPWASSTAFGVVVRSNPSNL